MFCLSVIMIYVGGFY